MTSTLVRLAVALTATLAGVVPLGVLAVPATAATCSGSGGVTVVVDHHELGGGVRTLCARSGGGRTGAAIFAEAGVSLTHATRQPGFVCRVDGAPASDPCVNASPVNAYWGLWWSDGKSPWTYSSRGYGSLTVPAGGSIAWSWQQDRPSGQPAPPGVPAPVAPTRATPTATPSPTRTPSPSAAASPSRTPSTTSAPAPTTAAPTPAATTAPESAPSASTGPTARRAKDRAAAADRRARRASREVAGGPAAAEDRGGAGRPTDTASPDAGSSTATGQPAAIPAWLTWGVFSALLLALVAGALVSRRRARA